MTFSYRLYIYLIISVIQIRLHLCGCLMWNEVLLLPHVALACMLWCVLLFSLSAESAASVGCHLRSVVIRAASVGCHFRGVVT